MTRLNTYPRTLIIFLSATLVFFLYTQWGNKNSMEPQIVLPSDLEEIAIRRFDDLAGKKELLYAPSSPQHFTDEGFEFEIRITTILKEKPIAPPDDPGRVKSGGPFINPPPSEVITTVGPAHRLLLNKFCVYRPMFVLPTIKFVKQTSDLDLADITAVWAVLGAFSTEQVALYNCGINSGSSQGHKHMQIVPQPDRKTFKLWPELADSPEIISTNIPNVPFKHFVLQIPQGATANDVYQKYQKLLVENAKALKEAKQDYDYNVAMTSRWIAIIPRSRAEWGGPFGANALGMLGLVSLRDDEEKDRWVKLGWTAHLRELGIAIKP